MLIKIIIMDKSKCKLTKVFTVKNSSGDTYYVQRMRQDCLDPPLYRVMKNRSILWPLDFVNEYKAIEILLDIIQRELEQAKRH